MRLGGRAAGENISRPVNGARLCSSLHLYARLCLNGHMLTEERRQAILDRLESDGKVVAAELSASLDVSPDTVRRDLRELADAGLLRRVHGGALPPAVGARPYAVRREQAPGGKGRDRACDRVASSATAR